MKYAIITGAITIAIFMSGCGKKSALPVGSSTPTTVQSTSALSGLPILQPALTASQQGDKSTAVSNFLAVDWRARPLFASGSALSLSEDQFHALHGLFSDADYTAKSTELTTQLGYLKQLASAVGEAGRDAAANGDAAQAGKCFTSLKQFGTALDSPDYTKIVQLVGVAYKKMADTEMSKHGQ